MYANFTIGIRSITTEQIAAELPGDFVVNRFLMKLFTSNDIQMIEFCRLQFSFKLPSEQIGYRCKKFASSEFVSVNLANFSCIYRLVSTSLF